MPEELTATYRIVTPMFLGGADQRCDGSLRAPSVKGALRFWWRALNWPRFRSAADDDTRALRDLHAEESRLFGLAAKEENGQQTGGQGCFLLTVRPTERDRLCSVSKGKVHPSFNDAVAARYLGYGLMVAFQTQAHAAGELIRDCLAEDQRFEVRLRFRDRIEPTVVDAVKALGLLGGLGSRARHGMGSIALEELQLGSTGMFSAPLNAMEYRLQVRGLLGFDETTPGPCRAVAVEPPFTAFWREARIDLLAAAADPYEALDVFAISLMRYRSWGQSARGNRLPGGSLSEKRFQDDHDWYRVTGWRSGNLDFHPKRAVFGLPHNYGRQPKDHVTPAHFDRRASALLLHIHPVDNKFLAVTTLLPARFLPPGEQIRAGGRVVPVATDWSIITDLLDGKEGNPPTSGAPDRFPGKQGILP